MPLQKGRTDREMLGIRDKFCDYYIHTLNGVKSLIKAYEDAGRKVPAYGHAKSQASKWLKEEKTQEMLREKRRAYLASAHMDPAALLMELQKMALARHSELLQIDDDGNGWYDLSLIDETLAAAMGECQIETYMEGRGEYAREVKRIKIKLHNKLDAIEKLMKHFGLYEKDNEQSGKAMMDALARGRARVSQPIIRGNGEKSGG